MNLKDIRNKYGNVDLRGGCPPGFSHVPGKRLQPLCRKLKIPFLVALVKLKETKFGTKVFTDGVVVSCLQKEKLIQAIADRNARAKTPEQRAIALKKAQARLENKMREEILNEFPLIPEAEIKNIVDHACEKGTGRVGRTKTLDINRKALLAVVAHIRHVHTPYDRILREEMEFVERYDWDGKEDARESARQQVEDDINKKCLEWGQKNTSCFI